MNQEVNTSENKYYIPNLNEFYLGFEYEYNYHTNPSKVDRWKREKYCITDRLLEIEQDLIKGMVRVKYLDTDDIEKCGFKYEQGLYVAQKEDDKIDSFTYKITLIEFIETKGQYLSINNIDNTCYFLGFIKNKSEFQNELERLNIKVKKEITTFSFGNSIN